MQADITTLDVDAIVNAANSSLAGGGGVDGAIHRAAGPRLVQASRPLAPCPPGEAVITPGFDLRARWVIHTVGPVWAGGDRSEDQLLESAYDASFTVAERQGDIASIAFPAISTGVYAFPRERAADIALAVMRRWEDRFDRIVACLFDAESFGLYRDRISD